MSERVSNVDFIATERAKMGHIGKLLDEAEEAVNFWYRSETGDTARESLANHIGRLTRHIESTRTAHEEALRRLERADAALRKYSAFVDEVGEDVAWEGMVWVLRKSLRAMAQPDEQEAGS